MRNRRDCSKYRKEIISAFRITTVKQLLSVVERFHLGKVAFRESKGTRVIEHTFDDLVRDVKAFGTMLCRMNMQGSHIGILGENAYFWVVAYLAVTGIGVAVPLDKELTLEDLCALSEQGNVEHLICSAKFMDTALHIRDTNPSVQSVIAWGCAGEMPEKTFAFEELAASGNRLINEQGDTAFMDYPVQPEDLAVIQFTSGTTGANKGVELRHRNICANTYSSMEVFPSGNQSISLLPMNHSFEFNCHILPAVYLGVNVGINAGLKRLTRDFQTYKPDFAFVVPLFLNEFYASIWMNARKGRKEAKLKTALFVSRFLRFLGIDIRDRLFAHIKETFGGQLNVFVCGGAPINERVAKCLDDMGFDIMHGYGITECSPLVAVNLKGRGTLQSVGNAVPGVTIRIDKTNSVGIGEVMVKGDNVTSGYYHDEESNRVSFEDGWFKTGDFGYVNRKGELFISGRKKNLIILDNGKNVSPEEIEGKIESACDYIRDIVVYDAVKKVKNKKIHNIAAAVSVRPDSELSMLDIEEIQKRVAEDIRKINHSLAFYKRIVSLYVTLEEFPKNATHKVLRNSAEVRRGTIAL